MGWFGRNKTDYPAWDVVAEDFIEDHLANYGDPHLKMILSEAKELIPEKYLPHVFICGGFAAHLAGITTQHNDVDMFCVTNEAFEAMHQIVKDHAEATDRMNQRVLDVQTRAYGKVLKFKFRDFKFDLVDFHERVEERSLLGVLMEFDFNWSMAGIDLLNESLMINRHALSRTPKVSAKRADVYLEGTLARLPKYGERLNKSPDLVELKKLEEITQARLNAQTKAQRQTTWGY